LVAITGATGYVGRFVVAELHRRGIQVRALSHATSDRGGFDAPVEWITGDLLSDSALAELVAGVDAVVHLAYEHVPGRYRGGEGDDLRSWLDANVQGSLRLLQAAQQAQVDRFVFLSSRAVFSHTEPGRTLDESHPTSPDTHYGAYKAAVESFLSSFAHRCGMRAYTVRATGVYGLTYPIERSKWWGLIQAVLADRPITAAHGGTEVYGGDVARVIAELLTRTDRLTDIVHLSDLYVTDREVVRLARELSGHAGDLPSLPSALPENLLVCRRLGELGLTLGGVSRLEATAAELVHAAQEHARHSSA